MKERESILYVVGVFNEGSIEAVWNLGGPSASSVRLLLSRGWSFFDAAR